MDPPRNLRELVPFREVLAERALVFTGPDGSTCALTVQVGHPVPDPEGSGNAFCPFRLLGFEKEHGFVAGGVDSLQALVLGLEILTDYVGAQARAQGGTVSWLGSAHLGFPALGASRKPPDG